MPTQYTIGGDKKINFSKSGALLSFGVQPILPVKDTSLPEFDRVSLDIWNYNDANLQATQLKSLETSLKSTEAIIYRPETNQFTYLGKINDRQIQMTRATLSDVLTPALQQGYAVPGFVVLGWEDARAFVEAQEVSSDYGRFLEAVE